MPEGLKVPPLPLAFERPMRLWQDLHRHRQTGMGLGNLTWPDFAAYQQVTGDRLSPGDLEAIRVIDSEFMASHAEAEKRRERAAERRKG